jgi:hypothetical protein
MRIHSGQGIGDGDGILDLEQIPRAEVFRHFHTLTCRPLRGTAANRFGDWNSERKSALASDLAAFADFLVDHFFLPCKVFVYLLSNHD